MISDSETKKIIIETMAFENASAQCKRIISSLKAGSALLEDQIQDTINIEAHGLNDDTWIGEVILRSLKKNCTITCFNCGRQGHLKGIVNGVYQNIF